MSSKQNKTRIGLLRKIFLSILPGLIVAGLIFSANIYYDLDLGKVVVQEITKIINQLETTATTTLATLSGNVGIGTTAPASKLTVNGDLFVSATSTLGSATSTPVIFSGYVQSNIIPYSDLTYSLGSSNFRWEELYVGTSTISNSLSLSYLTPGSVLFAGQGGTISQNNSNLFWDISNRRLGIGTSSPAYTLDINGTLRVSSTSTLADVLPLQDITYILGSPTLRWANIYAATGTFGSTITIGSDTIQGSATTTLFTGSNTNQLVLGANGNVGIGTTAPSEKLTVTGGNILITDGDAIFSSGNAKVSQNGLFICHDIDCTLTAATPTGVGIIINRSNPGIVVKNIGGPAAIFESGNVGIGTTSPAYTLDVNGNLRASLSLTAGINVEDLTGNKTLTPGVDKMIQFLNPNGANRIVYLATTTANAGDKFIIKNNDSYSSSYYLKIQQGSTVLDYIYARSIREYIFDGTNWVSGDVGTGISGSDYNVAIGYYAQGYNSGAAVGYNAQGYSSGAAVGYNAYGYSQGVAVGYNAQGYSSGVAVGNYAYGPSLGVAVGAFAYALNSGVAVGYNAQGYSSGVAVGNYAYGPSLGAAVGAFATGDSYGVAVGNYAYGPSYGAAVGAYAKGMRYGAALGAYAGYRIDITADRYNVLVGAYSGYQLTTGIGNIIIGYRAGYDSTYSPTTGSYNILIGYNAWTPANSTSNFLNIGGLIFGTNLSTTPNTISTGNVGIGTTAPNYKLTVSGGDIYGSNNLYISGKVGIGTTAPVSLLELYKTDASPILTITSATSTTYSPQIAFRTGATPTTNFTLGVDISTGKLKIVPSSDITTSTGITIDSSGNLGIGTTTPASKLTVNGDLFVSATSTLGSATSTPVIFGGYVQSSIIPYSDNQYTLGLSNYRWANIYAATGTFGGTITIGTNTIEGSATTTLFTTGNANQLVLGTNGNVGIGTTSPAYTLDVNGNLRASLSLTAGINVEDLTGNKTLTPGVDKMFQFLNPNGANRIVYLATTTANAGDKFIIKNNASYYYSSLYLQIQQGSTILDYIYAGSIREYIFDGTNWVSGDVGTGISGSDYNVAIGNNAQGYNSGAAVGYNASGYSAGAAVGSYASGSNYGAAVGYNAQGYSSGAAVGSYASGYSSGAAVGAYAKGMRYGAALGAYAGYSIDTTADRYNVLVGAYSGYQLTTGIGNIIIGYGAGYDSTYSPTTGSYNILIGYNSWTPATTTSNFLNIGGLIFGTNLSTTTNTISTGNVGIGTTAPNYKLTVNGDFYVSATSTLGSATSTPVIFGGYVQSNIIPYFDNQYTLGLSNYRWANIFAATGTFGGTITIGTNTIQGSATTTLFTTGNANQLVLGANGNVGIGTTAPNHKLTISSSASGNSVQMNIYNPTAGTGQVAGIRFHTASGWNVMLRTNQDTAWLELTDSDGNWVHRWSGGNYYASGNVGIGTTGPQTKLDVYQAGTSGWAGRIIVRNENVAPLMGVYNNVAVVGAHNASLTAWSPLYLNTDNLLSGYGNVIIGGNVGIGTTAPSVRLSLGTPVQARMLALHDNPTDWYGFGIQPAQMRLQVGNTGARFSFFAGDTTEVMTILGTGKVGIGTTSPSQKLTVAGNVGIQAGADAFIGTLDNYALSLRTNNADRVFITNTGNVGIGTTTPANKLHVYGDNMFLTLERSGGGAGKFANLNLRTAGVDNWFIGLRENDNNVHFFDQQSGIDALVIQQGTGNVGIGTTAPLSKLDVADDSGLTIRSPTAGYGALRIKPYAPGHTYHEFTSGAYENFAFMPAAGAGNVGIGTTAPNYKLTVNGDLYVSATSTLGSATSTPVIFGGYVQSNIIPYFDNQYTLGLSNYRWANIFAATGTFGGTITIGTNTIQGSATTTLFTTGNANQLVLGANGNVGIGTTGPSGKLHIVGDKTLIESTSGAYGQVQIGYPGSAGEASLTFLSYVTAFGSSPSVGTGGHGWTLGANVWGIGQKFGIGRSVPNYGSPFVTIDYNGNVGIGTTGPNYKLDVAGKGRFYGSNMFTALYLSGGSLDIDVGVDATRVSEGIRLFGPDNSTLDFSYDDGGVYYGITEWLRGSPGTLKPLRITVGGSGITIDTAGNVGIGTTAPDTKLVISGAGTIKFYANSVGDIQFSANARPHFASGDFTVFEGQVGSGTSRFQIVSGGNTYLVPSGGNVGIGTTAPNAKLEVAGTLRLTPITQSAAGACNASTKGAMYFDSDAGSYYYCDGTSWTKLKFTQDVYFQDADGQASALMSKSDDEGAIILQNFDTTFAAQVVNSANLTAAKAASIMDSPKITSAKIKAILDTGFLTNPDKIAALLDGDSLTAADAATHVNSGIYTDSLMASAFNSTYLAVSKAASILNNSNLSASKAASILDNSNLSVSKVASIMDSTNITSARIKAFLDTGSFTNADKIAALLDGDSLTAADAATHVNSGIYTDSLMASAFNSTYLAVSKAASILNNSNLSASKAASILNNSNLSVSKAVSILDNSNLSVSKVASIMDSTNITSARIKAFLDTGSFTDADKIAALLDGDSLTAADAATHVNSQIYSSSTMASAFNSTYLAAAKGASILDNTNLSSSTAAIILDNSNLSAAKAASILDNSNLSASKAASIFDNSNLSPSKAYSILTNANLSANKAQSIMYAMTNYAKQIDIITYGAPSTTTATTTISGVTRWSNVTTTAGTTLTLDGQPNVIIANTLTNYGTMDKTKTGGAGGRAADGAGAGGTGGGGVIIIVKNFVSSGTIQANGSSGGNAYGSTWNDYGDGGGAGNINRIGTHTLGSGGAGSVYNSGGGGPNGSASAGYGGVSGGSGGSVTYTTINTASDLYHQLRKAAIDWWLQNVASKTPSTTISFPNSYGSGGGGGGNYCSGSPDWNYYSGGGGGGSGGQVIVLADSLNNTGTIKANGGNGGNGWSYNEGIGGGGGGGGGGIVYALYRTTLVSAGTLQAVGGSGGSGRAGYGGAGGTGVATTLSVSGADIAENYPTDDPTIGPGDLVRIKSGILNELGGMLQGKDFLAEKYLIEKTDKPYDPQMIGVISVDPAIVLGEQGKENLRAVALVGRVPVKVTTKNGEIKVGDYLTSSDIPGVAMKATKPGRVIGIALESYSGPPDQIGWVTVFMNPHFALGSINDEGDFEELFKQIENASTTQSETSTSILEKFISLIKGALEKLGLFIENGIAKVKELFAEKLTAEIIVTKQLCVGKVCVDEAKFRELLEKNGIEPIILEESTSTPTSTLTSTSTTSTQEANTEQTSVNSSTTEATSSQATSTNEQGTTSNETTNNGTANNGATNNQTANNQATSSEPTSNETTSNETTNNQTTSNETMSNEQSGSEQSATNSLSTSAVTSTEETSQEISTSTNEQLSSEQQTANNQATSSEQQTADNGTTNNGATSSEQLNNEQSSTTASSTASSQ
jgi:hypothetical protein